MRICKKETKREVVDTTYEVCSDYCCKKMEEWLKIGTWHDRRSLLYDTNTGRFELCVRESIDYCHGDEDESAEEELNFCPFCGYKLQEPKLPKQKQKKKRFRRKK